MKIEAVTRMRWLRYGLSGLGAALLLLLCAAVWFIYAVTSRLDVPVAGQSSILDWAEPEVQVKAIARTDPSPALDLQRLTSPPPSSRPWTRWWWPGGDVTAAATCKQLNELHERGFGGVEIQAFNAWLNVVNDDDTEQRINSFDSPAWYSTLDKFMACAAQLDMAVYLNHLSGWPAGGPQVSLTDGLWTLRYGEKIVTGGRDLTLDLPAPEPGVNDYLMALAEYFLGFDLVGFALDQRKLAAVVAAKVVDGERKVNPLDPTDTLKLDSESLQILTDLVVDDELQWQAPPGEWAIIAAYLMPSAEAPTLVAAQESGYVIDHLDSEKLRAHYDYAYGVRTGLNAHYGGALKGFFNDSLEFKVDRLASADIFDAFFQRRGYDLTRYLPAVFVPTYDSFFIRDAGRNLAMPSFHLDELDERIRYDYQLTLSDLIIERFAETSMAWAQERNLLSRGQTYGFELDTIRALGANHIPETEHLWGSSSEYVMKLASAAGLLYQRPLVSAESFVWAKRAYAVTPRHIKAGADQLFISGVNQVIYHGVPFSPDEPVYRDTFGSLGWYPFQGPKNPSGFSGNYGPTSSIWKSLPELNSYISRSQNILQSGRPMVDMLVYYPFLGFPKSIEDSAIAAEEFLFKGLLPGDPQPAQGKGIGDLPFVKFMPDYNDPRVTWLEELIPWLRELDAAGITWTWVNAHALQTGRVDPEQFQALLVMNVEAMPLAATDALDSLATTSLDVFFTGKLPTRQPGFSDYVNSDAQVSSKIRSLSKGRQVADVSEIIAHVEPALQIEGNHTLKRVSRRTSETSFAHLLVNRSVEHTTGSLTPTAHGSLRYSYWFDADSGAVWPASPEPGGSYSLTLGPLESRFLLLTDEEIKNSGTPLSVILESALEAGTPIHGSPVEVGDKWTVTKGDQATVVKQPALLRESLPYSEEAPAEVWYETNFDIAEVASGRQTLLSLGTATGVVEITLNNVQLPTKSFDPFLFDISGALQVGTNQLRIKVTPPLRNFLVASEEVMDAELGQYADELGAVGLQGPVTLYHLSDDNLVH